MDHGRARFLAATRTAHRQKTLLHRHLVTRVSYRTRYGYRAYDRRFPDDDACKQYLVDVRWPDGVRCARCNNEKVYVVKGRPFTWVCKKCGKTPYRFSVLVGTIF